MKLSELSQKEGCLLAVVIDNEGNCLACHHNEGEHTPAFDRVAQALSEVTSSMEKLLIELELATGRSCLPQEGWALMGHELSVVMGNGGFRGIVMKENSGCPGMSLKEYLKELENGDSRRPQAGAAAV